MASGGVNRRSKWTPSTSASTLSTSRRLRFGSTTAASSPMPTVSQAGGGWSRARIRAMSSASERSEMSMERRLLGVVDGPGLANHRDLDLAGILELVLDAAGDVLGEPDGFLVGDLFTLDHDADLAA